MAKSLKKKLEEDIMKHFIKKAKVVQTVVQHYQKKIWPSKLFYLYVMIKNIPKVILFALNPLSKFLLYFGAYYCTL